ARQGCGLAVGAQPADQPAIAIQRPRQARRADAEGPSQPDEQLLERVRLGEGARQQLVSEVEPGPVSFERSCGWALIQEWHRRLPTTVHAVQPIRRAVDSDRTRNSRIVF